MQSLFLLLLPRLLIFALFSSLISFSTHTHTHTHKTTTVSFLRLHGKLFRSLFYADFRIETVHFWECSWSEIKIQDHSDHGTSKGPLYSIWTSIHRVAAVPLVRLGHHDPRDCKILVRYFKERTLKALHTNSLRKEICHSWHSVHIDPTFPSLKPLRIWIMQYTIKRLSWFVF